MNRRWGAAAMGWLGWTASALAQPCTPGWGPPFPNAPGLNGEVRDLAFFDDGQGERLYATGLFDFWGQGAIGVGIGRWNGTAWEPLPQNFSGGHGYCLGVFDLGSGPALYVGGSFTSAGAVAASRIARWDGAQWSGLGAGVNNTVLAMTVFDDGTGPAVYAVGAFSQAGGAPAKGIARWDGQSWSPLGSGLTGSGPSTGYSVGVFDLGAGPALYAGGTFQYAGGVPARNIARWDGTAWSAMGAGLYGTNAQVMRMTMFDDGFGPRLHIGGRFDVTPAGEFGARVARWTGSTWDQVGQTLSTNLNHYVSSLAVLPGASGARLLAGGVFKGGTWLNEINYVARFNGEGWVGIQRGMESYVRSLIVAHESGRDVVYAGGAFQAAGAAAASRVARLEEDHWVGLEHNLGIVGEGFPPAARVFQGNVYVATDNARSAGDVAVRSIAAWNGSEWDAVGGGITAADGSRVPLRDMAEFDDGSGPALYVTGAFDRAGATIAGNIARWDGVQWSALLGTSLNDEGYDLAVHDDGSGPALYVLGDFTLAGPVAANHVARWNGATWSALGAGVLGGPQVLTVHDEGLGPMLYIARESLLHRWDGSSWSEHGSVGGYWTVDVMHSFDEGSGPELLAKGLYTIGLDRWTGTGWSYWPTGGGVSPPTRVFAVCGFDDGAGPALLGAGDSWDPSQGPHADIYPRLRYRRAGQWHDDMEVGLAGVRVTAAAEGVVAGRRTVFVAGFITSVEGSPTGNFAQYFLCPPCFPDCNADGSLDIRDYICFQTRFALGEPAADCDGNGQLTLADYTCFQTKFATGCP